MTETNTIQLTPNQSLALRNLIEALKADDSILDSLPKAIRAAVCDICLGGYSTAEQQIKDLEVALEADMRTIEKLAAKIAKLEAQLILYGKPVTRIIDWQGEPLFDADPKCVHEIMDSPGGGVKCRNCRGWYCL